MSKCFKVLDFTGISSSKYTYMPYKSVGLSLCPARQKFLQLHFRFLSNFKTYTFSFLTSSFSLSPNTFSCYGSYSTHAYLFQHLSCQRSWMSSPWPCWSFSFNTAPQSCFSLKCCSVSPNFSLSKFYSSPLLYKRTLGRDFSPPEWRKFSPAIWCIAHSPHHLAFHCDDHHMRQADLTLSRVFFLPRWHLSFAGWAFFRSSRPFFMCARVSCKWES